MGINRKIVWVAALAAQVGMLAAAEPERKSGGDRTQLRIMVYVYNYAQVPGTVLGHASQQVESIYRAAGVDTEWVNCPLLERDSHKYPACRRVGSGHNWVAIRIISRSRMSGLKLGADKMGLAAVPEDGEFGQSAFVCSGCAEPLLEQGQFKEGATYAFGSIVGALMAHEIGHLVLGTLGHSGAGLMYSPWNLGDLKHAVQGQLVFTAKEARRIRDQVRERMRDAVETAEVRQQVHSGSQD